MALAVAGARTTMLARTAVATSVLACCLPVDESDQKEEGAGKDEINDDFLYCHVESIRIRNLSGIQPSRQSRRAGWCRGL